MGGALSLRCAAEEAFKTVELIIAEREWEPPPLRFVADMIVGVRVGFTEVELREQVKQAGGKWNSGRKVWGLRYDHVVALKLEARIVEEKASNSRYQHGERLDQGHSSSSSMRFKLVSTRLETLGAFSE